MILFQNMYGILINIFCYIYIRMYYNNDFISVAILVSKVVVILFEYIALNL